jgi:hypothetical protein
VPKLARFSTPARLPDPNPDAWSTRVARILAPYVDGSLPQFYDPTKKNTPPGTPEPMLSWAAFPAALRATTPSQAERWKLADGDRTLQDEYCEWSVQRNKERKITRITFTTEVPEYWEHMLETDPDRLVQLYRKLIDPSVKLADLRRSDGSYRRENRWNTSKPGRLAHLMKGDNTLVAAVDLVARATVLRVKNGQPVTNQQELVRCAGLGNPLRNSDPQIASAVNVAAGQGNEITLADPPGLHLGRPLTAGMVTPDGADAAQFWKIERGDAEHTLRARFEVPAQKRYVVGDIEIGGRPIQFGGQLADRVPIWVKAVVKKGHHKPKPKPCRA